MKTLIALTLVMLSILATGAFAQTQEKTGPQPRTAPESKLVEFHMALLKRGPRWSTDPGKSDPELQKKHVDYVLSLIESGKAMIAGPLKDDGEVRGVYIFRAKSAAEAKAWTMADPAVIAGHFIPEMHPWWSEDVIKKANPPFKFTTAFLAFLTRGDKWTPEKTPATDELQKAHIANIERLAALKKLVVAGPFGDSGTLRGIFVFRVDSLEEARALATTDPAVQAGRLALDIHPWMVPEGALP